MRTFATVVNDILAGVIDPLIPLIFTLAMIYFFWGMVTYIRRSGDSTKAKEGAQMMVYALLGLFVMFSVWGILALASDTFKLDNTNLPIPKFKDL